MFSALKSVFTKQRSLPLESFGKLPFYKDYIAVVSSREAIQWKAWLLSIFGRDGMIIPGGQWMFLFQEAENANLVIGLIKQSSDGIREFPYTLFSVWKCGRNGIAGSLEAAESVWQELDRIWVRIHQVNDINECYGILRGRMIVIDGGSTKKSVSRHSALQVTGPWPVLLVSEPAAAGRVFQVRNNRTSDQEFLLNWQQVQNR